MQRYSKKRQAILDALKQTTAHPTAEEIYRELKTAFPDLSLATVYRNLIQLKDAGLVRSVGTVNGQERFDAQLAPHQHAVCTRCGKIVDLPDIPIPEEVLQKITERTGYTVAFSDLRFSGLCRECRERENG